MIEIVPQIFIKINILIVTEMTKMSNFQKSIDKVRIYQ